MPEQPVAPTEPETVVDVPATAPPVQGSTVERAPLEDRDEWLEPEELPRRPRRRLLTPVPLALLAVLLVACGFIGGVLVEKGQSSSGTSAAGASSGLAARFAALRGGTSSVSGSTGTPATAGSTSSGSPAAGAGGAFGGIGGASSATVGEVAYLSGSTLYVTNTEGNTVKVNTSAATSVSKTVKSDVKSIHPGETVTVTGGAASDGTVSAESIRVGSGSGAFAGLFGGASSGTGSRSGSSGAGSSGSGGEPALFGKGG